MVAVFTVATVVVGISVVGGVVVAGVVVAGYGVVVAEAVVLARLVLVVAPWTVVAVVATRILVAEHRAETYKGDAAAGVARSATASASSEGPHDELASSSLRRALLAVAVALSGKEVEPG